MRRFILARLAQAVVSIFVLITVLFFMVRLTGDPVERMIPPQVTEEMANELKAAYGLDKPLLVQYGVFLGGLVTGDLGTSLYFRGRTVGELLSLRILPSLELSVFSMLFSLLIALPLGVYAAKYRGRGSDYVARIFSILGGAAPSFLVGLVMLRIFSVQLQWFPTGGREGLWSVVLPTFTLGWFVSAGIMRLTRSSMLESLYGDYVKLARIKGVRESVVIWKHAFKNAALPVITYATVIFAAVIGGAIVTEYVFAWPGLGSLLIRAVIQRDFPVIQGSVILIGSAFVLCNFLADLAYAWINPKIRYTR
ncbi:MAG: ABC transporter permease [bacterium]|nr:ABC transporter permease [bacterium]